MKTFFGLIDNDTLTLYYKDDFPESRFEIPSKLENGVCVFEKDRLSIKHIVIDESLKDYEIEYLDYLFCDLQNVESIIGFENINTSKLISCVNMFWDCKKLTQLDLSRFDTSNVQNMSYMFNGCSSLRELDLTNFSNVSLKWWDIPDEIHENGIACMFMNCINLENIYVSDKWDPNIFAVKRSGWVFKGCDSLITHDTKIDDPEFDGIYANAESGYFWRVA